ncbi:enoyl-CoA delta isomerase 3 [Physcomitrium patens]|uniref:Delta(3)-Delta(2)-enoyl-CoA isomerase n=1 Tax=Physcomitrium patens TaxID=3218 RepID=A9TQS6_PHYPA|nr:enoyl-CoA delta isomerase 3-like [Physcomitrium patens]PNR39131.1 hypothetical protein PHYPA_019409 [Physcomitrium patens]|eukprot:XP_024397222.1 enoyl-CoA delta isomerase 3-like [Physcomitrella patens]
MCSLERVGDVYILRFTGDLDEHRLNPALCDEIIRNLAIVNESDASALLTTNDGKYFSNGLDLAWVNQAPGSVSARMQSQSKAYFRLLSAFMLVNVPTVAAICGHAAAGGLILALAHDHRHMRQDKGFVYMSEMDISIPIPPRVMSLIRCKLNPRAFVETVLKGTKLTATKAKDLDIVDAVHGSSKETFDAALAEATRLASRRWKKEVYLSMRLTMYPQFVPRLEGRL